MPIKPKIYQVNIIDNAYPNMNDFVIVGKDSAGRSHLYPSDQSGKKLEDRPVEDRVSVQRTSVPDRINFVLTERHGKLYANVDHEINVNDCTGEPVANDQLKRFHSLALFEGNHKKNDPHHGFEIVKYLKRKKGQKFSKNEIVEEPPYLYAITAEVAHKKINNFVTTNGFKKINISESRSSQEMHSYIERQTPDGMIEKAARDYNGDKIPDQDITYLFLAQKDGAGERKGLKELAATIYLDGIALAPYMPPASSPVRTPHSPKFPQKTPPKLPIAVKPRHIV